VVLLTKRGGDQFHGSAYEYYRGSALNANRWDANRVGRSRPNIVDNRFGASLGGHFLPEVWKTFFYVHYEERLRSDALFFTRLVPTDTLKNGIITIGGKQYNFNPANGPLTTACAVTFSNPTGACDPRNLGFDPAIKQLWQMEPTGNSQGGDGVNTTGFSAFGKYPVDDYLGVIAWIIPSARVCTPRPAIAIIGRTPDFCVRWILAACSLVTPGEFLECFPRSPGSLATL
jgi:hypothetical protein